MSGTNSEGDATLIVDIDGAVARVTLNRPERRNALSLAAMRELLGELRRLGGNEQLAVVVIAGAGPVFSAGHDLSEMVGRPDETSATCGRKEIGEKRKRPSFKNVTN